MEFAKQRRKQAGIVSLGDMRRAGKVSGKINPEKFVNGPEEIDCLNRPFHRGDSTGILAGPGVGKCHAKDTPILMFDGTIKKVQDIKVGDLLMGPDSTSRKVLQLGRGREEMFKVNGTDGTSYIVNRSHILSLKYCRTESRYGMNKGDILNISIDEYLKKSDRFKSAFKGYRVGVDFDYKDTNFDPYLMGLFLGDGTKSNGGITTVDERIYQYLENYVQIKMGYKVQNANKNNPDKCPTYRITKPDGKNLYLDEIRKFTNKEGQRFIDKEYLINSREKRLSLLAGILDADGHLFHNCYDIVMKDSTFADDFEFLCRSLGFRVKRTIKDTYSKNIEFKGTYHRFSISGNVDEIPCKLQRKQASPRKQIKDPLNYGIALESLGEGDYYGFTIDGDHLFLLGDFVVTHNTTFILWMLKRILQNNDDGVVAFVSLEMTADEIAEKWFKATEDEPELADRLFLIENFDDKGRDKQMTITDIKQQLLTLKEGLQEDDGSPVTLHAYALDHLHEVDIGNSVDYNPLCRKIKAMSVELDSHGFILSQTTKGKGIGDIPVPKDGCYGTSRFENLMTNIITIFQPLRRVEKECNLPVLGWQFAKIRFKNRKDKVKEGMNYTLMYDHDSEDLIPLNTQDIATFKMYYEKVIELRQNEEKYKAFQFDLSRTIKGKDGKEVKKDDIFGGYNPDEQ